MNHTYSNFDWKFMRLLGLLSVGIICFLGNSYAQREYLREMLAMLPQVNQLSIASDTAGIFQIQDLPYALDSESVANLLVVDWSGDGVKDLILLNRHGNENAHIILNTPDGLNRKYSGGGRVVKLVRLAQGCEVWLYGAPGEEGGYRRSSLIKVRFSENGKLLERRVLSWNPDETIPHPENYDSILVTGILREQPFENDSNINTHLASTIGNRLAEFTDYKQALILSENQGWLQVCVPLGMISAEIGWIKNSQENMNANEKTILRLYEGFQQKNYRQMGECYADSATFQDPVFNLKNGKEARAMWHYLVTNGKDLTVTFRDIKADDKTGSAHWEATYLFSGTGRKVHNVIEAKFKFENGKIVEHRDHFKFWKWTRMALGGTGTFLGWTPLVKNKVRKTAAGGLKKFMADKPEYQ